MTRLTEDNIENFIRKNKAKFEVYRPPENHFEKFWMKLTFSIRQVINIVPYLVKAAIATLIITIASVVVWNNFIRKDRDVMSLGDKITLEYYRIKSHIK
jgi:hypothetical protein